MIRRTFNRVAWMAGLMLGIVCVCMGTRVVLAELNAYQVSAFLSDWSEKGERPSDEAWLVAHGAATRALKFAPVASARHQDRLGLVHYWRDQDRLYGDPEARPSREAALQAYRRAAELRPTWPHAQVRIVQTKLSLLEFDDEFSAAVRQAAQTGPNRQRIHGPIALAGLAAWHDLDREQRSLILESIHRVAWHPATSRMILEQAKRFRLSGEVCDVLDTDSPLHQRHCEA